MWLIISFFLYTEVGWSKGLIGKLALEEVYTITSIKIKDFYKLTSEVDWEKWILQIKRTTGPINKSININMVCLKLIGSKIGSLDEKIFKEKTFSFQIF